MLQWWLAGWSRPDPYNASLPVETRGLNDRSHNNTETWLPYYFYYQYPTSALCHYPNPNNQCNCAQLKHTVRCWANIAPMSTTTTSLALHRSLQGSTVRCWAARGFPLNSHTSPWLITVRIRASFNQDGGLIPSGQCTHKQLCIWATGHCKVKYQ